MAMDTIPDEFGLWLGPCVLFLLLLFPSLATPISKFVCRRIQMDAPTLRVGRERIPLANIAPLLRPQTASVGVPTAAQGYQGH
ncbi:hypothetical protein GCM10010244_42470 [Streptomyces coeruleorubidus]|nr:hypothetical protein GCM10010244_42470 [Streptomyces bellus]